jgi:parallel beta-helix repeat protein
MKRLVAISLAAAALCVPLPAHATHVSCGQTITTDTVLDSDLNCAPGNGITIGANDVDLDLHGHTIAGDADSFRQGLGIQASNRRNLTIRNGRVTGFQFTVYLGVDDSRVAGLYSYGNIRLGDQPTNNVLEDNVVTGPQGSFYPGTIEVNEDTYLSSQPFRPAYNRILNNTAGELSLRMVDRNEVRGNHITTNDLTVVGSGDPPHLFEGNGADENVIADNRVELPLRFSYAILLAQACRRNVVENNVVGGSGMRGIFVTTGCADNVIRGNEVTGATLNGIQLGDSSYRTARNLVEGNVVRNSAQDGIAATIGADADVLRDNAGVRERR